MVPQRNGSRRLLLAIALGALWLNLLVLAGAVGALSQRVEFVWMEAGPISETLNHPGAPGQRAQQRVERYKLLGRGFYAEHAMLVTTMDFSRRGAQGNSFTLAWVLTEEQRGAFSGYLPATSRNNLGPQFKVSGWFPMHLLLLATAVGVASAIAFRFMRGACRNKPVSEIR